MATKSSMLALGAGVLVTSCATYYTTSRTWGEPGHGQAWEQRGRVQWVRENTHVVQGHPGAGAAAGAAIGGLLGAAITGRGIGALLGATGGAIVGSESSQGSRRYLTYEVAVRFDDGSSRVFEFAGLPPFRPGDAVVLTPEGLAAAAAVSSAVPEETSGPTVAEPSSPPPGQEPPPPPFQPSAPAPPQNEPESLPAGQWVETQQYGWVWMPFAEAYTYAPPGGDADPYMYVYSPTVGWSWVVAPWLWGWGPVPYVAFHSGAHFRWYGHGWGSHWRGYRPEHYRHGFVYHGGFAPHRGGAPSRPRRH